MRILELFPGMESISEKFNPDLVSDITELSRYADHPEYHI